MKALTSQQIEKANAKFKKLTPEQKRVEIARDVVKQVGLEKYLPREGIYACQIGRSITFEQKRMLKATFPVCKCCAVGAAAMSIIRKDNDYKDRVIEETDLMLRFFSPDQRELMEQHFEGWRTHRNRPLNRIWWEKFKDDPTERLLAIFKNIIRNKGTFEP